MDGWWVSTAEEGRAGSYEQNKQIDSFKTINHTGFAILLIPMS